jgi:hypothetical protein
LSKKEPVPFCGAEVEALVTGVVSDKDSYRERERERGAVEDEKSMKSS